MANKPLVVSYDREGDILYIDKCEPYAEQESEEIEDEIVARLNPESNEVENLAILFFFKRLMAKERLIIPIDVSLIVANMSDQNGVASSWKNRTADWQAFIKEYAGAFPDFPTAEEICESV